MTLFVSPTEPPALRAIADMVSMVPERRGADILWPSKLGLVGVQRKEFPGDFIASVNDGRIAKQAKQMTALSLAVFIIEGDDRSLWSDAGELMSGWGGGKHRSADRTWTLDSQRAYLWSLRLEGIWVEHSYDLADTIRIVQHLRDWTNKAEHHATDRRTGPRGAWGKATNRDWAIHFLQGLPDVGPKLAGRIFDRFDGLPVGLTVTRDELLSVEGLGKGKADRILGVIGARDGDA